MVREPDPVIAVKWSVRGSWHLVAFETPLVTLCGRHISARMPTADELPGNERTCERCLLIAAKRAQ